MIVCVCNNISDREIRLAIDLGLSTMAELRRDLGIATCCGKCHTCAKGVLREHIDSKAVFNERILARPALSGHPMVTE